MRTAPSDAAPAWMHADIAARVAYTALPWPERLTTPPPPGLPGAWTARLVSRCVRVRRRDEKETDVEGQP